MDKSTEKIMTLYARALDYITTRDEGERIYTGEIQRLTHSNYLRAHAVLNLLCNHGYLKRNEKSGFIVVKTKSL